MENFCDVILKKHLGARHKKIKTIRYFIFFLNFDLDKGGASAPLAPSLIAPLVSSSLNFEHIKALLVVELIKSH